MIKKYNFAFFGLSGSGKTCILAALDMQRIAHPGGYTCSLLPINVKRPSGDPDEWTEAEQEADILHKSHNRLEQAKQKLAEGSVPLGTELSIDFIFDYKFSSIQTGDFYARLIDYGGELINPQNAPQEIAKELRDTLTEMDGILILAPVPLPEKNQKDISEKLNLLQKTMGLIHFPQTIPIALLMTKWDRIASLSSYSAARNPLTREELPTTEHHDLYNDFMNKVGIENCKAFPVSAFGACKRRTTIYQGKEIEAPQQVNPLASYGLLEGFIWLAQRLEEIRLQNEAAELQSLMLDLQNYETAIAGYKKWQPYPALSLWRLKRQGKQLINQFPNPSEMALRARQARTECSKVWWSRVMVLLPIIAMIVVFFWWGQQAYEDKRNYDEVHRILNHPNTEFQKILGAEKWLEQYYYTSAFWHPLSWLFVISRRQAKSELEQSRLRREQGLWQAVKQADSLPDKYQAAQIYQQQFRYGEYKAEIEKIIRQLDKKFHDDWLLFQKDYYELFNHGEFVEATWHLNQHPLQEAPQLLQLKDHFTQHIFDALKRQIENFIKHQSWSDAYDKLKRYYEWPLDFKNPQTEHQIGDLLDMVQQAEDHYFYTEFLEARDIERAENYLTQAPKQVMNVFVTKYKNYLIKIKNLLKLTLILERIEWGNLSDDDNIVTVFMNGKKIIETVEIEAITNGSTTELGDYTFQAKLNTSIKIRVKIVERHWFSGYDNNGEGSTIVQVKNLNGLILDLTTLDESIKNKAVFRLKGIPAEPDLPYFGERKAP
jgi:hypothetical protein